MSVALINVHIFGRHTLNNSLDKYTLNYILWRINAIINDAHRIEHNTLDFLEGFVYAMLVIQDEIKGMVSATETKSKD